ncbi:MULTISPECIES: TonB-dependent receptor [unclassified Sphingopyxis]|uniref:TonB-dependent receptor n=1 Tax=unclassified Sphingopyxis TaxID=2614943 RepID=UPI00286477A7|nr:MULTISPECIES: TonB-dependent receptor [unclassified Sphingopyxis]MDR6833027.1 iron complex outermembrane receptor protein [Sphingopyxis sp. BE122]MDR7228770.1 iron complex outermembrane receptor protein [Sphingopyxis sp. BE259]
MIRKLIVAALASTALSAPALAQETDDTATGEDTIIVTAARTILPPSALPLTIDVIGKDMLDQQLAMAGSVTDAVANLTPSFSPTRQKLSGAGETLRGRSPLYAINGIPQSTPLRDGSRDGFTIDGFFVDRVELIYGSNALQGIGGTGGIVNQVTVGAPTDDGISGRTLVQGTADNDFSKAGMGGKLAGLIQYKAGAFDATVGAAYEIRGVFSDAKGRPVGLNLTQGETQDSKTLSLFGRFGYELSPSARIDLIASRFELKGDGDYVAIAGNRTLGTPTSAVRGNPPGKSAQNRTESIALSLTDTDLGGGNLVSQIFFNRSRDTFGGEILTQAAFQDVRIAPIGTLFDQSQNRSRKFGGKLSYERGVPGFDDLTLTLGFDALWDTTEQRLIATGRTWVPPTDFRSLAPFAQANLKLFDGLIRVAGGARYENVKITIDDYTTLATTTTPRGGVSVAGGSPTFDDVLINGGVIIEPIDGIRAYASYAEGFTVPDVGRITRAIGTPGVDIDTFLDISPIVSNNREIGFEVKRGPLDASASYFWSSSDKGQLLIARPDRTFDVQRLRVEIQGLELNLGIQTPIDGLKLNVGYAHLIGRFDSDAVPDGRVDSDLDGTNISPDRLNLAANYNSGPFSARVQTQVYFKRRFDSKARAADDANPLRPLKLADNDFGGYTLTDANVRYQTAIGGISLSVQNLFNKQYIDYSSDTRLPTDQLSYFAGRGRTFTLGWDYRF